MTPSESGRGEVGGEAGVVAAWDTKEAVTKENPSSDAKAQTAFRESHAWSFVLAV